MSARTPTLTTDRLVLRAFTQADVPRVVRFAGSDEVHATTLNIPSPYTDQHATDWIATHEATLASGTGIVWAIADGHWTARAYPMATQRHPTGSTTPQWRISPTSNPRASA